MITKETANQVLTTLEYLKNSCDGHVSLYAWNTAGGSTALEALRAAIAQGESEPIHEDARAKLIWWVRERSMWDGMLPLIDVANMLEADGKHGTKPIGYVPLGDEQIKAIYQKWGTGRLDGFTEACRAIERTVREQA